MTLCHRCYNTASQTSFRCHVPSEIEQGKVVQNTQYTSKNRRSFKSFMVCNLSGKKWFLETYEQLPGNFCNQSASVKITEKFFFRNLSSFNHEKVIRAVDCWYEKIQRSSWYHTVLTWFVQDIFCSSSMKVFLLALFIILKIFLGTRK